VTSAFNRRFDSAEDTLRPMACTGRNQQDLVREASLEERVNGLHTASEQSESARQGWWSRPLVRQGLHRLIGTNSLQIADIMKVNESGHSSKPFGRVSDTKTKSLLFYAYDFDSQPVVKRTNTLCRNEGCRWIVRRRARAERGIGRCESSGPRNAGSDVSHPGDLNTSALRRKYSWSDLLTGSEARTSGRTNSVLRRRSFCSYFSIRADHLIPSTPQRLRSSRLSARMTTSPCSPLDLLRPICFRKMARNRKVSQGVRIGNEKSASVYSLSGRQSQERCNQLQSSAALICLKHWRQLSTRSIAEVPCSACSTVSPMPSGSSCLTRTLNGRQCGRHATEDRVFSSWSPWS